MTNDSHIQSGRDTIQAGRDVIQVGGDYVAGNKIVHIYQQMLHPVPFAFRAGVQRMVEDYTAIFGGRDAELARLDTFLTEDERPFGLLIAPTGRGKTALLIHWLARVQQQHADWRVVFAPISIRYQTASEQVALNLLAHTLAEVHNDLEQFRSYDQSPASLRALVGDYLRRPLPDGVKLLVVLDGLDESTGWQMSRELFPRTPNPGLKIVVAARDMAHRTRATWYRELGFERRLTCDLELEGLSQAAVRDLLQRMGNPLDQLATDVDVLAEIERVSQGDPVTIRLLVELLQAEEIQPGQLANVPADDLNAVLDLWLEHLREHERAHERVYALLSLVATAYGPLTTADVVKLDGTHLREPRDVEDAARTVARFVIGSGTPEQGYVFSHQKLREVYREQRLGEAQQAAVQQRFVQYGAQWYNDRSQPLPDCLRQFWVAHLQAAEEWDTMRRVLTEIVPVGESERYLQPWADTRYRAEGSYAGYLADLDVLWRWADAQQDIVLGVRCALIHASIRSLSSNLTPELLVGLVTVGTPEGKWSAAAALEHIRQMPDSERQVECIKALVEAGCELPWEMVLGVVRAIANEEQRVRVLGELAPHLPQALLPTVLEATHTIKNESNHTNAQTAATPHLPAKQHPYLSEQQGSVDLQKARDAARAIEDAWVRAYTLVNLIPRLLPAQHPLVLQEARDAARISTYEKSHPHLEYRSHAPSLEIQLSHKIRAHEDIEWGKYAETLAGIVSCLPPAQQHLVIQEILDVSRLIRDSKNQAHTLTTLARLLPPTQQSRIYRQALEDISPIADEKSRARVLMSLARNLLPDQLLIALDIARATEEDWSRDDPLVGLAPHLPSRLTPAALESLRTIKKMHNVTGILKAIAPNIPSDLLPTALEVARAITEANYRAEALSALAPYLPPDLLPTALEVARAITEANYRAKALSAFVPHLQQEQQILVLQEALDAAHADSAWNRTDVLIVLVPYLPDEQRPLIYQEVLDGFKDIRDEWVRVEKLKAIAPNIPSDLLPTALQVTRAITGANYRAEALSVLIPYLPLNLLPTALADVRTIIDAEIRAKALIALASHLPPAQQLTIFREELDAAHTIEYESNRADVLIILAPHLPPDLLPAVLDATDSIKNDEYRAKSLAGLAPHLPPDLLSVALEMSHTLTNKYLQSYRTTALLGLVPYLPPDRLPMVLGIAPTLFPENGLLSVLAPRLPLDLLPAALEAARAIKDGWSRAEALAALAPHLPSEQQPAVLDEALAAVRAIKREWDHAYALGMRDSHLPQALLPEALAAARAIKREYDRDRVLRSLAPHLATIPEQRRHWRETLPILAARGRATLLVDLVTLRPWLEALATPNDLADIAQSIVDVSRCWP